jgi:hypothetical protein
MITSRQIISLGDSYFTSKNISGNNVPVYVNPSTSDFNELIKFMKSVYKGIPFSPFDKSDPSIRFVAVSNNEKVYVTSGLFSIHNDILQILGISGTQENNPDILCGMIVPSRSGRPKAVTINDNSNLSKHNWSWLDKYFYFNVSTIKVFKGFNW